MRNLDPMSKNDASIPGAAAARRGEEPDLRPRARRYPIRTEVRWRRRGEARWHEGETVDISRSGVLFECAGEPPASGLLDMQIVFPVRVTLITLPALSIRVLPTCEGAAISRAGSPGDLLRQV